MGFWDLLGVVLVSENIVFDRKEPFFRKIETFLQHNILEYRKKLFSAKKNTHQTGILWTLKNVAINYSHTSPLKDWCGYMILRKISKIPDFFEF